MKIRTSKSTGAVSAAAVAILLFVACGGDDDAGSSGGDAGAGGAGGGGQAGDAGSAGLGGSGGAPGGQGGQNGGSSSGGSSTGTGGGSSGTGGNPSGGAGGSGGAVTDSCGNGTVDASEECDDGNTVDGDGCSSYCTSACETCWAEQCPDQVTGCFELQGTALTGLAAGSPLADLCAEVMRCMWENDCARTDIAECYCGPFSEVPLDECLTGAAAGPCKLEFEYSGESTDPADIELRVSQTQYALGAAGQLILCNQFFCADACFQGGPPGADGGTP